MMRSDESIGGVALATDDGSCDNYRAFKQTNRSGTHAGKSN